MAGKTALLIGATGQVGQHVLKELLASSEFTKVGEFGRRVTDLASLPDNKDKLIQKKIDFEKLEDAGLKDEKWDVVYVTLGTTKADAGSAEAFEKIDREYVVNAARAAKTDASQRLVYLSSAGASATSPFLYPKSKGLTENALAGLGYSDTIIFRPGLLVGTQRPKARLGESIFGGLTKLASFVTDQAEINVSTLGKSIVSAGLLGTAGLSAAIKATSVSTPEGHKFTAIDNAGALKFTKA
jgi:oxidoreductase